VRSRWLPEDGCPLGNSCTLPWLSLSRAPQAGGDSHLPVDRWPDFHTATLLSPVPALPIKRTRSKTRALGLPSLTRLNLATSLPPELHDNEDLYKKMERSTV
jgi:hypothetical protein